jgi:UDP-glucose 4-epimerase
MKKAVVTGAVGYIGSVLCKMLKENGYYVIGVDQNFHTCSPIMDKYCDEHIDDDFSKLSWYLFKEHDLTYFHLAANTSVSESALQPLRYFENNTSKTIKLLQSLRSSTFIFASSAAVYAPTNNFISESYDLNPINVYGRSKLWCEQAIDSCYELNKLRACSFRFFNVIGNYKDVGVQSGTGHLLTALCDKTLREETFTVFGNDYNTVDGTCVRDYVHVVDVCRAMIHAAQHLDGKDPCHLKYNLGTGVGTSVKEMVDIFRVMVYNINVKYMPRRIGDPPFLVSNHKKFINDTGFKYDYNSDCLPEIISSVWSSKQ